MKLPQIERTFLGAVLLVNILVMLLIWQNGSPEASSEAQGGLSEAPSGAVIDASKYPTIQAAIDALSNRGGSVSYTHLTLPTTPYV